MARKKLKEETLEVQEEVNEETVIEPEQEEIQLPEPLQTFMELYKNNDKTVVPHAVGVEIWKCWQRYVKRTRPALRSRARHLRGHHQDRRL